MKRLLLAALAAPMALGFTQEQDVQPDRTVYSGSAYVKMHSRVPAYAAAAHLADVLYSIHDGQRFIDVDIPVIAPLGLKVPLHPVIRDGRLLQRLELEGIRMTKFMAHESEQASGAPSVRVTADFTLTMSPSGDGLLAAEVLGLAIGSDSRIDVRTQPKATPGAEAGLWELQGLVLDVGVPAEHEAVDISESGRDPVTGAAVVSAEWGSHLARYVRMAAQDQRVKFGSVIVEKVEDIPANEHRGGYMQSVVHTNTPGGSKLNLAKIANFTTVVSERTKMVSMVGLGVELNQDGRLELRAVFESPK